jgi:type IV secretory pathway VirB4 component
MADLLPYAVDLGDGIIGNVDGSFTVIYAMRGPDLASSAPEVRLSHHLLFARAMNTLREGWMLHTYVGRGKIEQYPLSGDFTSRTGWLIEEERKQAFKFGAARYFNDMHIALTYQPVDPKYRQAAKFFRDDVDEDNLPGDEELQIFVAGLGTIEGLCGRALRLQRLDKRSVHIEGEGSIEIDDRLTFFEKQISGSRQEVRALPDDAHWAAAVAAPIRTGLRLRVGDDLVSVVTIDNVPDKARTTLMRKIYGVDQVCDIVVRWIVRDEENIAGEMKLTRKKAYAKRQSTGDAITGGSPFLDSGQIGKANDVNGAMIDLGAGEAYGYISFAIVLRQTVERSEGRAGERRAAKELDAACGKVMAALRSSKFTPRREVENVFDAFMSTLPGMGFAQVRKGITGSRPFSYLSPLTSVWTGSLMAPCSFYPTGSTALTYVATEGRAPMAFNLHVRNVGHALITGATGGGKSTALAFMIAQHERYGPRSRRIILDLNRSMETMVRSMENGVHLDFSNDSVRLAPFADIREPGGMERAQTFVAYLLFCNNVNYDEHRSDIYAALKSMANSKAKPSMLSLSSAGFLKSKVRTVLERYTRGSEGEMLDGEDDVFPDTATICIELERIMALDPAVKKPLLVALINRIEKLFDGRPTLFVLDEAWKALNDEILGIVIGEKIKTVRKANVAMVFGTQSIADLEGHPLEATLKGPDVPTKIFCNNPMARTPVVAELLTSVGLDAWEIEDIASAGLGEYYIASPDGRRLFSFGLGPVTLAFVGSSDKDSVAEMKLMVAEDEAYLTANGKTIARPWPARWIEKKVKSKRARDWADAWIAGPKNDGSRLFGVAPTAPLSQLAGKVA